MDYKPQKQGKIYIKMDKVKKSVTLNSETKKLLEELSKRIGVNENAIISIAIHRLNSEV